MKHSAHYFAVAQLARRDYSHHEVQSKLKQKGFEDVEVEEALDRCESSGFLDDSRYAELIIRSHVNKGHGPIRIKQSMLPKGLAKDGINLASWMLAIVIGLNLHRKKRLRNIAIAQ